jgi:hypothetical protein
MPFEHRLQRQHDEGKVDGDHADDHRELGVHDLQRFANEAESEERRVHESAVAEQHHPAGGAHGVADKERQDDRHQQEVLEARPRTGQAISHRKREHDADRRAHAATRMVRNRTAR